MTPVNAWGFSCLLALHVYAHVVSTQADAFLHRLYLGCLIYPSCLDLEVINLVSHVDIVLGS